MRFSSYDMHVDMYCAAVSVHAQSCMYFLVVGFSRLDCSWTKYSLYIYLRTLSFAV